MASTDERTYKERKTLGQRRRLFEEISRNNPGKIPVIIERLNGERPLPNIDRAQFLVAESTTIAELCSVIRRRLQLTANQSIILYVNDKVMPGVMTPMWKLHQAEKGEDGFLYINYCGQATFG
uniref:Autophagy-related protein n=1 Tax=Steinernema glaseri TaxID=37863 RepID=A0A1I7ZBI5_9BILA